MISRFKPTGHKSLQPKMKAALGASPLHLHTIHACQHTDVFSSAASLSDTVAYRRIQTPMKVYIALFSHANQAATLGLAYVQCVTASIRLLSFLHNVVIINIATVCGSRSRKGWRTTVRSTIAAKEITPRCTNTSSGLQHSLVFKKRTCWLYRRS